MPRNVYDQHRASFPNVAAYVITDKLGNRVANVAIKFNSLLYAYVHVFGAEMKRGQAGGGGYDKTSTAVLDAIRKIDVEAYGAAEGDFGTLRAHAQAFKGLVDCGETWDAQLRRAGYNVLQAV